MKMDDKKLFSKYVLKDPLFLPNQCQCRLSYCFSTGFQVIRHCERQSKVDFHLFLLSPLRCLNNVMSPQEPCHSESYRLSNALLDYYPCYYRQCFASSRVKVCLLLPEPKRKQHIYARGLEKEFQCCKADNLQSHWIAVG